MKTFEEVLVDLLPHIENPIDTFVTKGDESTAGDALSSQKDVIEFLKKTLSADIRRYFSATTEAERDQIKGAFRRTLYILGLALPKENVSVMKSKLTGTRKPIKDLQEE